MVHRELPHLPPFPPRNVYDLIMWLYTGLCHQIPSRSFFWRGHQFPICARDTGTYLGFLITHILFLRVPFLRRKLKPLTQNVVIAWISLILAIIPFGIDGVTSYLGLRETTNFIRLATGLLVGGALGLIIAVFTLGIEEDIPLRLFTRESWRKALAPIVLSLLFLLLPLATLPNGILNGFWYWTLAVGIIYVLSSYNHMIALALFGKEREKRVLRLITVLLLIALELGGTALLKIASLKKLMMMRR